jgi:sortase A
MTSGPAISVPAVGIRAAIESNVNASSLAAGAGHYPGTGWPGQGRTIGLAGHDVTFVPTAEGGHVFQRLIAAKVGQRIFIRWHRRTFVYRITGHKVVRPTTVGVLRNVGYERLVLTTCYPPGSAGLRLVTFARLDTAKTMSYWRSLIQAVAAGRRAATSPAETIGPP